jgi:cellulose synthase (UDP-forming)
VLTVCALVSIPPMVYGQIRMIEHSRWLYGYIPFAVFGLLCFALSVTADGISRGFDLEEHKRIVAAWKPQRYPSVDVFMPVCGEPVEVLRNAWSYIAILRDHYPGRVVPYVLDDTASPGTKAMAREFGFGYATRPNRGWFKKSGNLDYGFQVSDGEFILLLDADFAPRADLLDEALPYFDAFPDLGIVQTPQFFHVLDEQTWVERGAGAAQEMFYRSIQTARTSRGAAVCVGSCAVYRRKALEQNEGMSIAEHSEDLHTGFDLYRLGWMLRYLPIALSTGNCPDNVMAFFNQQYRWCSGTYSLLGRKKFWQTPLPLRSRLCYLSGLLYYIYTAVWVFVLPVLSIVLLAVAPGILQFKNSLYLAPILIYSGVIFPMWHRVPYRLEAFSVRVISAWAHAFALTDTMRGRLRGWQPSGTGATKQDGRRRFWIGLIGWGLGSAVVWVGLGLWRMMTMNPYNFLLLFVMGVFQLVVIGRILLQPRVGATS